jgi:hypothetical protein
MAVIEYMMVKDGPRRQVPDFVGDRGHYQSPIDNSYIGWVDDVRDYYVPDTVVHLTKAQFVARQVACHAHTPFRISTPNANGMVIPGENLVTLTEAEVISNSEAWYDQFVANNQTS